MRISDWSSDVCSSDLSVDDDAFRLRRPPDAQPRRAGAPDLARLLRPATRHVAGTRHGGVRERRELSDGLARRPRSEEHTSELQSLMRISYAVFCLKKKNTAPLTC